MIGSDGGREAYGFVKYLIGAIEVLMNVNSE